MKHAAIVVILILILPDPCPGHTVPNPRLEPAMLETSVWEGYRLDIGQFGQDGPSSRLDPGHDLFVVGLRPSSGSLRTLAHGLPRDPRPAPRDMVSMMSLLWAEIFGGVDIVAEVKEFTLQLRRKNSRPGTVQDGMKFRRSRWNLVIACCVDDQMELAARFSDSIRPFDGDSMALQVKAVDPRIEDVGLIMSYIDGGVSLKADNVNLADVAEVKLVVKF